MSLEQKVRQEVDNWDISVRLNGQAVMYEGLIKSICYGIGIAVTEKGLQLYLNDIAVGGNLKKYTEFGYKEAVKEFRKDLIAYQYLKYGNVKKVAEAMNIGDGKEGGRVSLCNMLARLGLKFKDIKNDPKKYTCLQEKILFRINDDEIVDILNREIKRYSEILEPILFRKLINNNSQNMAIKFATLAKGIAQDYVEAHRLDINKYEYLSFHEALKLFEMNYFEQQIIESGMNGKLAAERSKLSYDSYRGHLSRRNISMKKLRQ